MSGNAALPCTGTLNADAFVIRFANFTSSLLCIIYKGILLNTLIKINRQWFERLTMEAARKENECNNYYKHLNNKNISE